MNFTFFLTLILILKLSLLLGKVEDLPLPIHTPPPEFIISTSQEISLLTTGYKFRDVETGL